MGLESWRTLCDCIECYQTYIVINKKDEEVTKEDLDFVLNVQLPEGHEFTDEVKDKIENIKSVFDKRVNTKEETEKETKENTTTNDNASKSKDNADTVRINNNHQFYNNDKNNNYKHKNTKYFSSGKAR